MSISNVNYADFNNIWAAKSVSLTCSGPGVIAHSDNEDFLLAL